MTAQSNLSTKRTYSLDFLKVLATTFILFHHYQQDGKIRFLNHPNFYFNEKFEWGLMVELFFILSGFVMYHYCDGRLSKTSFSSFMGRRLMRLLPPMAASAVVYFVLGYVYQQIYLKPFYFQESVNLWGTVVSALGLQSGWGLNGWHINNPTWYVSVLLLCYCWFFVITKLSQKHRFPLAYAYLLMLLVSFAGLRLPVMEGLEFPLFGMDAVRGYKAFFFGLLLAMFYHHFTLNRWLVSLCLAVMGIVVVFMVFAHGYTDYRMTFTYLFCPALILVMHTKPAQKLFGHSCWNHLSAISYHVYIWHNVLQLLLYTINTPLWTSDNPVYMYLFALIAWVVGLLSWLLFDGPVQRILPNILHTVFEKRTDEKTVSEEK
ncbi:MAG: acyltransferase [Clostridia bacterium]|nr:acyltransferase [Clostridia bacterium]